MPRISRKQIFAKTTRYGYVLIGALSIWCVFYATMLNFFKKDGSKIKDANLANHLFAIFIGIIAALIQACQDNYFKGGLIENNILPKPDIESGIINNSDEFGTYGTYGTCRPKREKKRKKTSYSIQFLYLFGSVIFTFLQNWFLALAFKAWILGIQGKIDSTFTPLNITELLPVILISLLVDVPFNWTNADYETSKTINEKITGFKDNDLIINLVIKLFSNPVGRFWISKTGTCSHVAAHMISLLLCIRPKTFLKIKENAGLLIIFCLVGLFLMIFNFIQTYYFEAKTSLENLSGAEKIPKETYKEKKSTLIIKYGLYVNLPIHAIDDIVPIILILRHLLKKTSMSKIIVLIIGFILSILSMPGNYYSETKGSIKELEGERQNESIAEGPGYFSA